MMRLSIALVCTISLGLVSRLYPVGFFVYDKSLGDVLYAVAAYLVLALVFYRQPRWRIAALALVLCLAVEFFQATGIPDRYEHITIVRWLLGTTFSWHDVVCYVIGVVVAWGLDGKFLRAVKRKR